MNHVTVCICTEQYLGYYKQFLNSSKKHLTGCDNLLYYIGNSSPNLDCNIININDWAIKSKYSDILTTICSLRPRSVLDAFKTYDRVLFVGAKIEFFSGGNLILQELNTNDAVTTPHILEPLPEDGLFPSNDSVSFTGHLSTDLVGFKNTPQIVKFLSWMDDMMVTKAETNQYKYLDQSYLNFLPYFANNVSIFKHLGTNVAYWNMYQREMKKENGVWRMKDGSPLVAFQYSGLDLDNPKSISRHQNRWTAEGDILEFLTDYARRVKSE